MIILETPWFTIQNDAKKVKIQLEQHKYKDEYYKEYNIKMF